MEVTKHRNEFEQELNELKAELEKLRSQLSIPCLSPECELPNAVTLLNRLKKKNPKSKAALKNVELSLDILERY